MCGQPIDQTLERHPNPHPLSSVVDEWKPRHLGGSALDPANTVELHRLCNGIKSGHWPVTEKLRDRCRTQVAALLHPVIRRW